MLCPKPIGQPDPPSQNSAPARPVAKTRVHQSFQAESTPHVGRASNQSARQPTTWVPDLHAEARDYGLS